MWRSLWAGTASLFCLAAFSACGQAGTFEVPGCHTYNRFDSSFVKLCGESYDHAQWLLGIEEAVGYMHLRNGGALGGVAHVPFTVFDAKLNGFEDPITDSRFGGFYYPYSGGRIEIYPTMEHPHPWRSALCHELQHAFDHHQRDYYPSAECGFDIECHFFEGTQAFDKIKDCSRHLEKVLGSPHE